MHMCDQPQNHILDIFISTSRYLTFPFIEETYLEGESCKLKSPAENAFDGGTLMSVGRRMGNREVRLCFASGLT